MVDVAGLSARAAVADDITSLLVLPLLAALQRRLLPTQVAKLLLLEAWLQRPAPSETWTVFPSFHHKLPG